MRCVPFTRKAHITWRSQTSRPKDTSRSAKAEHIVEKMQALQPAFLRFFNAD
jgi:hypothetical protein